MTTLDPKDTRRFLQSHGLSDRARSITETDSPPVLPQITTRRLARVLLTLPPIFVAPFLSAFFLVVASNLPKSSDYNTRTVVQALNEVGTDRLVRSQLHPKQKTNVEQDAWEHGSGAVGPLHEDYHQIEIQGIDNQILQASGPQYVQGSEMDESIAGPLSGLTVFRYVDGPSARVVVGFWPLEKGATLNHAALKKRLRSAWDFLPDDAEMTVRRKSVEEGILEEKRRPVRLTIQHRLDDPDRIPGLSNSIEALSEFMSFELDPEFRIGDGQYKALNDQTRRDCRSISLDMLKMTLRSCAERTNQMSHLNLVVQTEHTVLSALRQEAIRNELTDRLSSSVLDKLTIERSEQGFKITARNDHTADQRRQARLHLKRLRSKRLIQSVVPAMFRQIQQIGPVKLKPSGPRAGPTRTITDEVSEEPVEVHGYSARRLSDDYAQNSFVIDVTNVGSEAVNSFSTDMTPIKGQTTIQNRRVDRIKRKPFYRNGTLRFYFLSTPDEKRFLPSDDTTRLF